jgi:hypothetical protein
LLRAGSLEKIGWWNVTTDHWPGFSSSTWSSQAACTSMNCWRRDDVTAAVFEFSEMNRTPW